MGSYGPAPDQVEPPDGMVLVGYRCTASDHGCLVALDEVVRDWPDAGDGDVLGPNHHAYWVPVFANTADLAE